MKKDITEQVLIGDFVKHEDNPTENSSSDEHEAAFANLKVAVGGAKGAMDELADIFGGIIQGAEKNNGKIGNVNNILRQVLENELKELEVSGGDQARIDELRNILKQ